MPPKKGGKSKSKKKGGDGPKKLSKKELKLRKKYTGLQLEDKNGKESSAVLLRRDELEWAAEKMKESVTIQREERIKFQLERDFLYDIMQTYWKKYRCLQIEEERKIADTNRMNQDADDNKTIKGIEGKHFRYEAQLNATAMDVRDEIRKKRLKEMLEAQWQLLAQDIEEQNELLDKNTEKYRQQINDTREKLDDLQKYVDDHAAQLAITTNEMINQMENSTKLFHLVRRMEIQMTEERWGEFIWKLNHNFELQLAALKHYYNDASHSNLTLIFTLQDWMNEAAEKRSLYESQIAEYESLLADAHERMPELKKEYSAARTRHDFVVRTKQGIRTSNKEIVIASAALAAQQSETRQLLNNFNSLNAEREYLKANCETLINQAGATFRKRFEVDKVEKEAKDEGAIHRRAKDGLKGYFPNVGATAGPYKKAMDRKDEMLERQRLNCMRIYKQSEDLRSSLEARLLSVGLKRKHRTETPEAGFAFGRSTRLSWGPAALVAGRKYPLPTKPKKLELSPLENKCCLTEDDTAIRVCPTDSIKGFLVWKAKGKNARGTMAPKMSLFSNLQQ